MNKSDFKATILLNLEETCFDTVDNIPIVFTTKSDIKTYSGNFIRENYRHGYRYVFIYINSKNSIPVYEIYKLIGFYTIVKKILVETLTGDENIKTFMRKEKIKDILD